MLDAPASALSIARLLGVRSAVKTVEQQAGDVPPPVRLGDAMVAWLESDIENWIDGLRRDG